MNEQHVIIPGNTRIGKRDAQALRNFADVVEGLSLNNIADLIGGLNDPRPIYSILSILYQCADRAVDNWCYKKNVDQQINEMCGE